jgi:hypothetical protein
LALVEALSNKILAIGVPLLALFSNREVMQILRLLFNLDIFFAIDFRTGKFDSERAILICFDVVLPRSLSGRRWKLGQWLSVLLLALLLHLLRSKN